MKMLFHHRIASRDGQAVHMDELCAALEKLGHTVVLVGASRTAKVAFGAGAGPIAWLQRHLPRAAYEFMEFGYNAVAVPRLWLAIRRHRPDAVYERYNLVALAGTVLRPFNRLPLLMEINSPLFEGRAAEDGIALRRFAAWTQRMAWRSADYALPVTDVLADFVRRAGVPTGRIVVIPNGIDPDKFSTFPDRDEAKRQLGLSGKLVLGFTGFVRQWNGLDRVVDLLADLRRTQDVHLLLVGDGPTRAGLEARAKSAGISDRLTITGIVPRHDVARHLATFDLALQPGVTAYASPLKLFEYMAAGLAIVAPGQPNIREILTDRVDSLLVDLDRPEELASAIYELCRDGDLRARLGASARATIEERGLTWVNNAKRVVDLIDGSRTMTDAGRPYEAAPSR